MFVIERDDQFQKLVAVLSDTKEATSLCPDCFEELIPAEQEDKHHCLNCSRDWGYLELDLVHTAMFLEYVLKYKPDSDSSEFFPILAACNVLGAAGAMLVPCARMEAPTEAIKKLIQLVRMHGTMVMLGVMGGTHLEEFLTDLMAVDGEDDDADTD